ncbi:zeta toxin domain [Tanacetum coccineum]
MVMATVRPDHRKFMPAVVVRQRKLLRRKDGVFSCTSKSMVSGVRCDGILLLEVMTGKKPTDDMFNDGLSLYKFSCSLQISCSKHKTTGCSDDARIMIYGSEFLILSAYAPSMPPLLSLPLFMACADSDGTQKMILMKVKQGWKNVLKATLKHLPSAEKHLGNTAVLNDAGWLHSSVARERFHDDHYDCLFRQSGSVETRGVKKIEHHNQRMQTNSETTQCIIRKDKLLGFWAEIAKNAIVAEAGAFKETYVIYRALISEVNHNDVIQTAELVIRSVGEGVGGLMNSNLQDDEVGDGTTSMVIWLLLGK